MSMQATKTILLSLAFLFFLSGFSVAEQKENESEAIIAAKVFLLLIDGGQYQTSWDKTTPLFNSQVSQVKWAEMLAGVRPPFGAVISRNIKVEKFSTSLPGVPDGAYVMIQFSTSFEKKSEAVETVTMARVQEEWQVAGYFINQTKTAELRFAPAGAKGESRSRAIGQESIAAWQGLTFAGRDAR